MYMSQQKDFIIRSDLRLLKATQRGAFYMGATLCNKRYQKIIWEPSIETM